MKTSDSPNQRDKKQPAPYLCHGGDEFQRDKETLTRDKDKESESGE